MAPMPDFSVQAERYIKRGLARLPRPISRFLGHRDETVAPSPDYLVCIWGFIGAFCGLSVIFAVFGHTEYFTSRLVPPIVASFGASAILCYGSIDAPLAQPRSLVFGHFFSALIGVIIATIFQFNLEHDPTPRLQWVAASLSTAIALVVMHLTRTTHPPAGATALIPCIDPHIWALRWYFLPVVLLSSSLILFTALLVNNIQRVYPRFWIKAIPPVAAAEKEAMERKKEEERKNEPDPESADSLSPHPSR
ncbi:unnamed protein product [Periconia digitata]|uniref:HPP transmembrane region domain-containing protein n=1 Tax=Periconia digitata TaxID=1303443 RepID=A0A9W4UPI0_9PLEO|nr:unnamed protein product [Periconia digitata]